MPFINEEIGDGVWRTIDKEHGFILSRVSGPSPEGTYDCELLIKGHIVRFSGYSGMKIFGVAELGKKSVFDMNWSITHLFIPLDIGLDKSRVLQIIEEALCARGWNFQADRTHSVSVSFNKEIL